MQSLIMRDLFLVFLILCCFACNDAEPCNPGEPKGIQTIYLSNNGAVSYLHEIEVAGISLKCDSTTVMSLVNRYMAANANDTPISQIEIFRSMKHFDSGESLSQPEEYGDDRVFEISFEKKTLQPKSFVFYDDGRQIFEGDRWYHN